MTPTGAIRTKNPSGGSFGLDWSAITRWEDEIADGSHRGVPVPRIAATIVIESGGNPDAIQRNPSNGDSYGLMQIVPYGVGWEGWHDTIADIANVHDTRDNVLRVIREPLTNIMVGAWILETLYAQYGSWDKASSAFFLGNPDWRGQDTVNGNTGEGYRRSLNGLIEEYGEGGTAPVADPVIYDLIRDADAQRFGLSRAEANRILDNRYTNRNGKRPEVIVYHVQDGFTTGSLDWWANGPGVQASSTNMVQRDGSILNIIPKQHGPWTNGDTNNPSARARRWQQQFGSDLNPVSLTIEAEDERTLNINAKQKDSIVWQARRWIVEWPHLADPDRHLGHFDINSVSRPNCGKYRDSIVAALGTTPAPDPDPPTPVPGLPAWATEAHVKAAFPQFDARYPVSKALVRYMAKSGTLPVFKEVRSIDEDSSLWVFDRVTLIHEGNTARYEGEV